ncbi:FKBP-type peptidyl-prolyl cis-trans isomerase [Tenacibaculum sp. IB213877]|uniref:FKBP-type peptidyl-prolyl cis-trans isomerase n=1 Tax=Tenacibaculum sp. IB213877 TaxID=3097351 RepID=UPI002A5995CC|nr:FKBP-type peptidyl-prolyl cis-trans isomerase [Tenacibaculum sp. IB213877]MDY0779855.1 FKBP-type peptidyl-prolyl cis-trans isomerase [Tenacibaculum sp. IB213877]
MKLNKVIAIAALGLVVVSCNSQLKTKSSLENEIDSVSYAIGLDMASQLKTNFGDDIDKDVLIQGYLAGIDSTNLLIKHEDVRKVIMPFFQKKRMEMMQKKQEEMAKKAEKEFGENKKAGEEFLAENKTKDGVITTESGLQYVVLKEGNGEAPKATDRVKVHYHGTLLDGTVFDSSVDRGEPSEFGVSQVIKGWTEGLQLMKPGAKYKFFIPQELAYGAQQRGEKIKPFSALIFEVELLEVK